MVKGCAVFAGGGLFDRDLLPRDPHLLRVDEPVDVKREREAKERQKTGAAFCQGRSGHFRSARAACDPFDDAEDVHAEHRDPEYGEKAEPDIAEALKNIFGGVIRHKGAKQHQTGAESHRDERQKIQGPPALKVI